LLEVGSPCSGALVTAEALLESFPIVLSDSAAGSPCVLLAFASVSLLLLMGDGMRTFVGSGICSRSDNRPLNSFWDVKIDLGSGFVDMKGRSSPCHLRPRG
jgi:hypothetical protein